MISLRKAFTIGVLLAATVSSQVLYGVVTDALSGMPIEGAKITLDGVEGAWESSLQGQYRSETLAAGAYFARVVAQGYLPFSRKVILTSPTTVGASDLELNASLYNIKTDAASSAGDLSVNYFFPGHAAVEITIYNADGKVVRTAFDRSRLGGTRVYRWDGRNNQGSPVPPGRYSCRFRSRNMTMIKHLTIEAESTGELPGPESTNPAETLPEPLEPSDETPGADEE